MHAGGGCDRCMAEPLLYQLEVSGLLQEPSGERMTAAVRHAVVHRLPRACIDQDKAAKWIKAADCSAVARSPSDMTKIA